jgi:hypothetical protein
MGRYHGVEVLSGDSRSEYGERRGGRQGKLRAILLERPRMTSFQLVGLSHEPFERLFLLPDEELGRRGIRRSVAAEAGQYPCRVSLEDVPQGTELLLLAYEHQPAISPYRASGPIYVSRGARQRSLPPDTVTPYVTKRLMSVRAYDAEDLIVDAAVCEGVRVDEEIRRLFERTDVSYIHLHNARRGCYSCRVQRA